MKTIRLIELFAGYGSQAMALEKLGYDFEHHFVCEFDKYAVRAYNAAHGTDFEPSDICNIHAVDLNIVDKAQFTYLLTYSFPCTDLSIIGEREGMAQGSNTRSGLLWEVKRILEECGHDLPQFLVMENVPMIHSEKNMVDFSKWIHFLDGLGYKSKWQDLNAVNFGVPQNRTRCFMVSWLGESRPYMFPEGNTPVTPLSEYLETDVEEKYILSDRFLEYFIKNSEKKRANGKGFQFEPITDPSRDICQTITCKCGNRNTDPFVTMPDGHVRRLTAMECYKLMGVPEDAAKRMIDVNSITQCIKQAGNSIVVDVLAEVFRNLFDENAPGQMTFFDYL